MNGVNFEYAKTFSSISRDIAQVIFASVFVGPLVGGAINIFLAFSGLLLSVFFWYASVLFIKFIKL